MADEERTPILGLPLRPNLRAPHGPEDAARRTELVERAIVNRARLAKYFDDVALWNEHVRRPHEQRIDPDPTGEMAELVRYYDTLINGAVT